MAGVRYDLEMDVLIGDVNGRRGCLHHPDVTTHCRPVASGVMTFPDDVIEQQRSTDDRWVAVFPVGVAHSTVNSVCFVEINHKKIPYNTGKAGEANCKPVVCPIN